MVFKPRQVQDVRIVKFNEILSIKKTILGEGEILDENLNLNSHNNSHPYPYPYPHPHPYPYPWCYPYPRFSNAGFTL